MYLYTGPRTAFWIIEKKENRKILVKIRPSVAQTSERVSFTQPNRTNYHEDRLTKPKNPPLAQSPDKPSLFPIITFPTRLFLPLHYSVQWKMHPGFTLRCVGSYGKRRTSAAGTRVLYFAEFSVIPEIVINSWRVRLHWSMRKEFTNNTVNKLHSWNEQIVLRQQNCQTCR